MQTVTVTVINDDIDELNPHTGTITLAPISVDPNFSALPSQTIDATIADDDTTGIVISPATGASVNEAGATSTSIDVSLRSEPIGDVHVTWTNDAQITATGASPLDLHECQLGHCAADHSHGS